jgi:hypothetical protein
VSMMMAVVVGQFTVAPGDTPAHTVHSGTFTVVAGDPPERPEARPTPQQLADDERFREAIAEIRRVVERNEERKAREPAVERLQRAVEENRRIREERGRDVNVSVRSVRATRPPVREVVRRAMELEAMGYSAVPSGTPPLTFLAPPTPPPQPASYGYQTMPVYLGTPTTYYGQTGVVCGPGGCAPVQRPGLLRRIGF